VSERVKERNVRLNQEFLLKRYLPTLLLFHSLIHSFLPKKPLLNFLVYPVGFTNFALRFSGILQLSQFLYNAYDTTIST